MAFKKFLKSVLETVVIAAVAVVAVMALRNFAFNPYAISGTSMAPNFQNGDYVFVDELSYRFHSPRRGDVAVFHAPLTPDEDLIKRIIGLPGERIVVGNDKVQIFNRDNPDGFILDETYLGDANPTTGAADVELGPGQYFVMGDNRPVSFDSRSWGALDIENIVGKVALRIWPLNTAQAFAAPEY